MDPLKTPEFSSQSMRDAMEISEYHANRKKTLDNNDNKYSLQNSLFYNERCFDPDVSSYLRTADHDFVVKNSSLYASKDGSKNAPFKRDPVKPVKQVSSRAKASK